MEEMDDRRDSCANCLELHEYANNNNDDVIDKITFKSHLGPFDVGIQMKVSTIIF